MDKKILKIVLQKKKAFVPAIFTEKQFEALRRHDCGKKLSNADKKALYSAVKRKMEALEMLSREQRDTEYYISGADKMLAGRLEKAKTILNEYSKKYDKAFVSGSFLFSKEFKDIDIFIIREKGYDERWDGNRHIAFLTEKKLRNPVFQSAALISVSNFIIIRKIEKKKISLSGLLGVYHEAVIEKIRKEKKPESARSLIFYYALFCENRVLDPMELKERTEKAGLGELDKMTKELCRNLFSGAYLYIALHDYIKTLKESIKNIKPNEHLIRFKNLYEEIIYGNQRNKAEAC